MNIFKNAMKHFINSYDESIHKIVTYACCSYKTEIKIKENPPAMNLLTFTYLGSVVLFYVHLIYW